MTTGCQGGGEVDGELGEKGEGIKQREKLIDTYIHKGVSKNCKTIWNDPKLVPIRISIEDKRENSEK